MSGFNPYRTESNGDHWAERAGKPCRSNPAFKDLSDEAFAIACEWHDEVSAEHKQRQEAKARSEQYERDHPEEIEAMRRQYRASF